MDQEDTLDIAIIGMSARFPGAKDLDLFWDNLRTGKESIRFFSDDELAEYHDTHDPKYVKAAPVLDDVDKFDASFFGYAPREAQMMDPQHRILLECATSALEHAGYATDSYEGLISVFAGAAMNTYLLFSGLAPHYIDEYLPTLIGNDKDFLATRISYKLNLKGPSVTVQSACSTALVATHMACQSLLNGESDMALAGAVSVRVPHNAGHQYIPGSVFTPDGHCRPFDAKANGTIFGSGVGVVVLKRLENALEDGDYIHAVIKGSAINNDGSSKVDYTAPSVESQSEAIAEALGVSGVDARTITYVEAHGTGTAIGDPIEVAALTRAFRHYTDQNNFCAIGSVKSNVGHLDVAAGMAGLIKTILALKHKRLPATLHYTAANPEIRFSETPFYVNDSLNEWNPDVGVRRAGVSALGIGGTNAHLILEEAPHQAAAPLSESPQLFVLSAKTEDALARSTSNLKDFLIKNPDVSIKDVTYTLQEGRNDFVYKRFMVASDAQEAIKILKGEQPDLLKGGALKAVSREIIFMFPGQGAQYINMGRDLYEHEKIYRATLDECASLLLDVLSVDIRTLLFPAEGEEKSATDALNQTSMTQPVLFSICYALAKQLNSWGIHAEAFIGHSIGEYVAACLSGVFSLQDALRVVATRGRLMQAMPEGSMLAVSLSENEIRPLLGDSLSLAAINGVEMCVVSGSDSAIDTLAASLSEKGINAKKLHTSHGFHSSMMQPAADEFKAFLNGVHLKGPSIPFVSNLTGTWITVQQATDAQYWADHLRNAVQFEKGLKHLLEDPSRIFLEVGPGSTLSSLIRMHPGRQESHKAIPCIRHPKHDEPDHRFILNSLGQLWLHGVHPNWNGVHGEETGRRIPIPTYPFARQSHWFAPLESHKPSPNGRAPHKHTIQDQPTLYIPEWKRVTPTKSEFKSTSTWLFFRDQAPLSEQCVGVLEKKNQLVLSVYAGTEFKQLSDTSWSINPREHAHYDQLLRVIKESSHLPDHLVHAWNAGESPQSDPVLITQETYEDALYRGFFSLLFLSQAIQKQDYVHPIRLGVVTSGAYEVLGTEDVAPIYATLHGPCKVIEKEIPNVRCSHIDLDSDLEGDLTSKAESMLDYMCSKASLAMLALRGRHLWVPDFSPLSQDVSENHLPVKKKGVYLITGGLGGLGLAFATWLAQDYQATLLLASRTELPGREQWPQLLQDSSTDKRLLEKLTSILDLESYGARVGVLKADVTHLDELETELQKAEKAYGSLDGIIHAAGVIEDTLIPLKDIDSSLRVLAPKILGTLNLNRAIKTRALDFFVLCSSINAYLSPAGQFDYTAGNGYLDAFAYALRQRTGVNVLSINWPGWKETGMLASKKEAFGNQAWFKKEYARGISTEEGILALKTALAASYTQAVVSKEWIDLAAEYVESPNSTPASQGVSTTNGVSAEPASGSTSSSTDPIEKRLQLIWSHVLGVKEIGINDDFFEMGGHSLLAVTLFKKMEQELGALHLPISALIKAPTVARFSNLIKPKETPDRWSPLVKIQEGNGAIPLFCVHGAGGNILIYRELAEQLGSAFTVYGLESQGLDGKQPLLSTISDMAAQYVEEIQQIHPDGPYLIIGYCMGGSIALEMAHQLRKQGHSVPFLGLLETYNWINLKPENPVSKARYLWQKIEFHTRNLLLLPSAERKLFFEDKLNTLKRRRKVWSGMRKTNASGQQDEEELHHKTLASVWKNNDDAALVYEPTYYDGTITHFRPQQEYAIYSGPDMRFDKVAREVQTLILPVYPAGMMVPPFVSQLAKEIRDRITSVTQNQRSEETAN